VSEVPAEAAASPLVNAHADAERGAPDAPQAAVRLTAWLAGQVQGVGMRWWVRSRALDLGLAGQVANLDDGRVEVVAEGPPEACDRLLRQLSEQPSTLGRPGHVRTVTHRLDPARGRPPGFMER
jgi:acylphosphatase